MSLGRLDRSAGAALRALVRRAGAEPHARFAAGTLSPGFRVLVAAWIARRATRRGGLAALVASVGAATLARVLRDAIGRPRPGPRREGGFPSRHAAAATAVARAASRHGLGAGAVGSAALVGLTSRVATGDHDPLDILAGAAIGAATEGAVARVLGRRAVASRLS